MCIYPPQVEVANRVFSPTAEQLAKAKRIVAAFDKAELEGSASIQIDGHFIDYPIVEKARKVVALAERIAGASS